MLKKAQRDCAATVRSTTATLSRAVEAEIDTCYHNFQMSIMCQRDPGDPASIATLRKEYFALEPNELLRVVLTKYRQLLLMLNKAEVMWEPGKGSHGVSHADRKKINKIIDLVNSIVAYLASDVLFVKLFQVCSTEFF